MVKKNKQDKRDRDTDSIVSMLYNLDVLYENDSDDLKDEIEKAFEESEAYCMEQDESLVVFFRNNFLDNKKTKEKIYEKCRNFVQRPDDLILFFEIENSFENFMPDEEVEGLRNELLEKLREKTKFYKRNIEFTNYALTSTDKKVVSIPVRDIFNSIENSVKVNVKGDNGEDIRLYNYNFIVSINEIVKKLYGNLGNGLFDKNVRYEVEGTPGKRVEESIQKTYKEEPQMFFFKNNGISLYIKDRKKLKVNTQSMEITLDPNEPVSVINGAQTITAVSKVLNEKYNKACVLLRVYTLTGDKIDTLQNEINDVTVALNQQKPINNEDIAMLSNFVIALNDEYGESDENNKYAFSIVKRGDTTASPISHHYFLKSFAQKAVAVIEKDPGKARSRPASILKLDENNNLEEKIFRIDSDEPSIIFDKFKPINLAFSIWETINDKSFWEGKVKEKIEEKDSKSEHIDPFVNYGKYLVLSILTNALLGNFTKVKEKNNYKSDGWEIAGDKKDELIEIINSVYKSFDDFFKGKEQLDSNDFKTTEGVYDHIIGDEKVKAAVQKYSKNIVIYNFLKVGHPVN